MEKDPKKIARYRAAIAFTGIGMQMLVTILLFFYVGSELDERQGAESSTWTLILTLTGVVVALYLTIKGMMKLLK